MAIDRSKVVWFEGMALDPHHFQQWDRANERSLNSRVRAVSAFDSGLIKMDIDRERLANGEFVLVRCNAVLPDGLYLDAPESDRLPEPRSVQDVFSPTQDRVTAYLAVPSERQDGKNVQLQDASRLRETRFAASTLSVPDQNTGIDVRQIEVARVESQIRFSGESLSDYSTIPLAQIRRDASGAYVEDGYFIPPCVSITGSERLFAITGKLLELLVAKGTALFDRQKQMAMQREFSPADALVLGLQGTINTYTPLLNHLYKNPQLHPEVLYRTLIALAGQLTTYVPGKGIQPRELPVYDHADLTRCFNRLDETVRTLLGEASPAANYVEIPLRLQRENLYVGSIGEELLTRSQMFLVVRSEDVDEATLIQEIPRMLRFASPNTIDAVLRSYTRALEVQHTHRLPSGLPVDHQANYFSVQKQGPFWDRIQAERAVAIFVPTEFSQIKIQLVAVREPG